MAISERVCSRGAAEMTWRSSSSLVGGHVRRSTDLLATMWMAPLSRQRPRNYLPGSMSGFGITIVLQDEVNQEGDT